MFRSIKAQKIIIVIFLTVLIWVWSDLAQDEETSITNIPVTIANTDKSLWVSFVHEDGTLSQATEIEKIALKGSQSQISDIRDLDQNLKLEVDPENEGLTNEGKEPIMWGLSSFLERNTIINGLALAITDYQPKSLRVQVRRLTKKTLPIRCIDRNGLPVPGATTEPEEIEIFVPVDDSSPNAYVRLTDSDTDSARSTPINKTPYVEIDGRESRAAEDVAVRTQSRADLLGEELIVNVNFGLLLTEGIATKYEVDIRDERLLVTDININATQEAARDYQSQSYHVVLVIDNIKTGEQQKTLEYRFPPEFVRADHIELNQAPQTVSFRLIPIKGSDATATK